MQVDNILFEQDFNGIGMSIDEVKFYLRVLSNCKDICDSDNKVNGVSKGKILKLSFKKDGDVIKANGPFVIGKDSIYENRWINADIYINEKSIIVDMLVTRICVEGNNKVYRVLDQFEIKDNKLNRRSQYNYDMQSIYTDIEDEEMKGRLR